MIYLSKRDALPRYAAERSKGRRLRWWASPTGKADDLQLIQAHSVPRSVQQQIARARYRTRIGAGS